MSRGGRNGLGDLGAATGSLTRQMSSSVGSEGLVRDLISVVAK